MADYESTAYMSLERLKESFSQVHLVFWGRVALTDGHIYIYKYDT